MGKNIVLCSDGTGNSDIKDRGTNVFKLYEAIDIQNRKYNAAATPQIAFYDDGVGTQKFLPIKLLGGAFGWGFTQNIKDLYKNLVVSFEEGDKIFLFGFSRGAYTVRALSGLIHHCGVLQSDRLPTPMALRTAIDECWDYFRNISFRSQLAQAPRYAALHTPIHFIGVWDTVGAVGLPDELKKPLFALYPMEFRNGKPTPNIIHARHALSIDDERRSFTPVLWDERDYITDRCFDVGQEPTLRQVWFPGVHCNVGGGYPKQGISLIALDWMMHEAKQYGLQFIDSDLKCITGHIDAHDTLYDSRSGLSVYYVWKPRDITQLCAEVHIERPLIHVSAIERIVQGSYEYAPGNIPFNSVIVSNQCSNAVAPSGSQIWPSNSTLQQITMSLNTSCNTAKNINAPRDAVAHVITSGKRSYYCFLVSSLVYLLILGLAIFGDLSTPYAVWATAVFALFAIGVRFWARRVDAQLERAYTTYWLPLRTEIRKLL
jgi:hypothetical protein